MLSEKECGFRGELHRRAVFFSLLALSLAGWRRLVGGGGDRPALAHTNASSSAHARSLPRTLPRNHWLNLAGLQLGNTLESQNNFGKPHTSSQEWSTAIPR